MEMEKCYFQYHLNIHILSQFIITLEKGLWKGTLICQNCDTLMCFCLTCENQHNLVFTHVPSQHPFTCVTRYFSEWELHHINDVGKVLAPYVPSSITLKGWLVHMGEWNKGCFFYISCNNGLHNLVFYETFFLHFQCVHVVVCNGCC